MTLALGNRMAPAAAGFVPTEMAAESKFAMPPEARSPKLTSNVAIATVFAGLTIGVDPKNANFADVEVPNEVPVVVPADQAPWLRAAARD